MKLNSGKCLYRDDDFKLWQQRAHSKKKHKLFHVKCNFFHLFFYSCSFKFNCIYFFINSVRCTYINIAYNNTRQVLEYFLWTSVFFLLVVFLLLSDDLRCRIILLICLQNLSVPLLRNNRTNATLHFNIIFFY